MKLTTEQKKEIVALYAGGGISQEELARRYKVSRALIAKIVAKDDSFAQKVADVKKDAEISMLEYIASRRGKAQSLMDALLDMPIEMVEKASMRDRMGALKILSECFAASEAERMADTNVTVSLEIRDLTIKEKTDES